MSGDQTVGKMTVSVLAERVGITSSALRYYERIGLWPEPTRSDGGYRLYDDADEARVRFVKRAQRFGLRLDEISELLAIRQRGLCSCGHTHDLLTARLAEIEQQMAEMARLRSDIQRMVDEPPAADPKPGCSCGGELVSLAAGPANHSEHEPDRVKEASDG